MEDPIKNHPTRAEQLDILADVIAGLADPGELVVDLGCGVGYLAHLLTAKRGDLRYLGIDRNPEALANAAAGFADRPEYRWQPGDLQQIDALEIEEPVRFIVSVLAFHDLTDAEKRRVIAWAGARLGDDGMFLLYDRLRLAAPELFGAQRVLWDRLERVHGWGMRRADSFPDYLRDLGAGNNPAALDDYRVWFADAGLGFAPLHLHGNIALMAAAPRG
jgi:SAM-dependent methyltransferase